MTQDPFAGMTVYRRDPKTGKLVADNWGEPEMPEVDTSYGSSTAMPAAPATAVPATPAVAVPVDGVWTDKTTGSIAAAPVANTPATP
jgi:hypothetical protein